MIWVDGRKADIRAAVPPDRVNTTIAFALSAAAVRHDDSATAWAVVSSALYWPAATYKSALSTSLAMRTIVSTDSMGKSPDAVSAESMIASVPSIIALATSEVSALVGRGLRIIESSICVAVMTGLPALLHAWMIFF